MRPSCFTCAHHSKTKYEHPCDVCYREGHHYDHWEIRLRDMDLFLAELDRLYYGSPS